MTATKLIKAVFLTATLLVLLVLVACGATPTGSPVVALPTITVPVAASPAPTVTPTPVPSATSTPTTTFTPTPTVTHTPTPTCTPIPKVTIVGVGEVTQLEAELFDEALSDYRHAYGLPKNQAISLQTAQVAGTALEVALSTDGVPLMVRGNGTWRLPGYRDFAPNGKNIGSEINVWSGPNLSNPSYTEAFNREFNMGATGGILDSGFYSKIPQGEKLSVDQVISAYDWRQFDEVTKYLGNSDKEVLLTHIFSGAGVFAHYNAPEWMRQMSDQELKDWVVRHTEAVAARLETNGVTPKAISVANEIFWHGPDRNAADQVWMEGDYLYSRLHDDYIKISYQKAREMWPNAQLLFNDDNSTSGEQSHTPLNEEAKAELNYIKRMRQAGVPIDGFGSQTHLIARNFLAGKGSDEENIEANITRYKNQLAQLIQMYKDIGVTFSITELDVNVGGLPADWTQQQKEDLKARLFVAVFETALDSGNCNIIVSWGFSNASSWVLGSGYPYGPGESPLPLDGRFRPTKSAFEIMRVLLAHR